jgi:TRAP-type C4-dicarboxylate transport system substrate-binding protein
MNHKPVLSVLAAAAAALLLAGCASNPTPTRPQARRPPAAAATGSPARGVGDLQRRRCHLRPADDPHHQQAVVMAQLVEGALGQCSRLGVQQDAVAQHHQGRDRRDPERLGQLRLRFGADLAEDVLVALGGQPGGGRPTS